MNNNYHSLTQYEKDILTAKINHAISKDNICFEAVQEVLGLAECKGLFSDVKFGHKEVYKVPDEQQRELID